MKKIKVLIVDDSELIRTLLASILSSDSSIEVVGSAADPLDAREKIKALNPDVITLDIEMPKMDGLTFLEKIMRLRPMPVVMISTLTEKGADITLQALQLGAVDYISKPKLDVRNTLELLSYEIVSKVKMAAKVNIAALTAQTEEVHEDKPVVLGSKLNGKYDLIAIGASTGGTEAIKKVLAALPNTMPPIVIVQHMPPGFTQSFAKRLNANLELTVSEFNTAKELLKNNCIYVADGSAHMVIRKAGNGYCMVRDESAPVNRHRPSVDVLFDSLSHCCGSNAISVILTGMGNDGAAGMKKMRDAKSLTIAQDQNSSAVWGMPRIAIEQNAALEVLPLSKIGGRLTELCYA